MIYTTFKQWVKGRVLETGQPRKQFYTQEDFALIEMGWGYGFDAGVEWQKSQTALDKKADNARELGLNYEDQDMIEIEYQLKAQESDVEQEEKPFYKVEGPNHVVCQCDKCKDKQVLCIKGN